MEFLRNIKFLLYIIIFVSPVYIFADPAAIFSDPGMTHVVFGIDRFPTEKENWKFDLSFSPFYQHSTGARDKNGNKVPEGDRLGLWQTLPILVSTASTNAAPVCKPYTEQNYKTLYKLRNAANVVITDCMITCTNTDGAYSVDIDYEKMGMRFCLDAALSGGFGLSIKTGAADYKQTPTFRDKTNYEDADSTPVKYLQDNSVMLQCTQAELATELGYSLERYQTTAFEDTFAELYWSNGFIFNDKDGNKVVKVSPYIGAGVWIPTGKKYNQDRFFSLPSGQDGFWGLTLEGALNFDFPGTILVNFGGGITVFETKTLCSQRVPNHPRQVGFIPWKAKIRKEPGPAWNFSFSIIGKKIVDNLNVYFDYLYCRHERDSICMKEDDCSRNQLFYPKVLEENSVWRSQMFQLGFNYEITPNLAFGVAGQTHISGFRVYKTHTILGSVTFTF